MIRSQRYAGFYPVGILCLFLLFKLVLMMLFVYARQDVLFTCFPEEAIAAETVSQEKTNQNIMESRFKKRGRDSNEKDVSAAVIERKKFELEMERRDIEREREQLTALRKEIKKKLAELSKLQEDIKEIVAKKGEAHKRKIRHLIKVYTSMSPKRAAGLVEKLDIDIIVEVFSNMKGDSVGKILSYVRPEKAAVISERLIKK